MGIINNDEMMLGEAIDVHDELKSILEKRLSEAENSDDYTMIQTWLGVLIALWNLPSETIVKITWDYDGYPILKTYKEEE